RERIVRGSIALLPLLHREPPTAAAHLFELAHDEVEAGPCLFQRRGGGRNGVAQPHQALAVVVLVVVVGPVSSAANSPDLRSKAALPLAMARSRSRCSSSNSRSSRTSPSGPITSSGSA